MPEFIKSITDWFKERTTSPLYSTFIFSLIFYNWKFFYILFWQSEDKLKLPRIEYVERVILSNESYLLHVINFFLIPSVLTYLIIEHLPKLSIWAHKRQVSSYYEKRENYDERRLEYEKSKSDSLEKIVEEKKKQVVVEEEIKNNTTQEDRWNEEYSKLTNNQIYSKLNQIVKVIYEHGGRTRIWNTNRQSYDLYADLDIIAFAHTNGIIEKEGIDGQERLTLTLKGKFFISKFIENANKPF